ncbi:MAG: hypothetical protein KDB40_24570, partial [Acidimicrobiales bacterium]|nr:hypothetical protein [Acidimicrobiales bacterium]
HSPPQLTEFRGTQNVRLPDRRRRHLLGAGLHSPPQLTGFGGTQDVRFTGIAVFWVPTSTHRRSSPISVAPRTVWGRWPGFATFAAVGAGGPLQVLVVCTANVCRSPMAEGLLRTRAEAAGLDLVVASAGTRKGPLPVDPVAVKALGEFGVDISAHQPRRVTRDLVATDGAGLILTMTRAHLRDIAVMGPGVFQRTYTLREAVRRLEVTPNGGDLPAMIAAAGEGRKPSDLMRDDPGDDIDDPYNNGYAAVLKAATEIDQLVQRLVGRLRG